jgi:hypothetical protein
MKKFILTATLITLFGINLQAQEKYGKTLNLGVGLGYYGNATLPALHLNYEFDVFKNFTLAPFVSYLTHKNYYYGYDKRYGTKNYYYRETMIPIGLKGSYYFDELFNAGEKWDFYAAASAGFALRTVSWVDEFEDKGVIGDPSPLYVTLHIGSELHLSEKAGLFLDLSTGMSTFGVAFHF